MKDTQTTSPRRRLQELLAIPAAQRTDAQWDELNELEIALASVNRAETQGPSDRRNAPVSADRAKPSGGAQGKRPPRKPRKGKTP